MMAFSSEKVLYLYLMFCAGIHGTSIALAQGVVGDSCGPLNDMKCTLVTDCQEAVDRLKKGERGHGLAKCGWQGLDEIVCCSSKSLVKIPTRTSIAACEEYSKRYGKDSTPFITNGVNASIGEFPYIAALGYEKVTGAGTTIEWACAGVLISDTFILTACHCLFRPDSKLPKMARLGKVDLEGNDDNLEPQDISIIESIVHPNYDHGTKVNDIALLRLEAPVRFTTYVKPVCLNQNRDIPSALLVAGWGHTKSGGDPSRFLLKAYVAPFDLDKCNQTYLTSSTKRAIQDTQMCAVAKEFDGSDTCQGDSGGPIQVENKKDTPETPLIVVGVTSYGRGCGGDFPSVYTRVSSYIGWIESIVWPRIP